MASADEAKIKALARDVIKLANFCRHQCEWSPVYAAVVAASLVGYIADDGSSHCLDKATADLIRELLRHEVSPRG